MGDLQVATSWIKMTFFPRAAISCQKLLRKGWRPTGPSLILAVMLRAPACADCVQVSTAAVHLGMQRPCQGQRTAFHSSLPYPLVLTSCPLFPVFSESWGFGTNVPFRAEHSISLILSTLSSYEPLHWQITALILQKEVSIVPLV